MGSGVWLLARSARCLMPSIHLRIIAMSVNSTSRLNRIKGLDPHALFSIWTERYHVADCHLLELGEDALGTGLAKIIQPIVAVPASSCDANLHQPGPDLLRSRLDGHGAGGIKCGLLDHVIAGHGTGHLFIGGSPAQLPGTNEAQVHSKQNDSKGC